jgi:hypothetical protein
MPAGYPPGYVPTSTGTSWSPTEALSFGWEQFKKDPGTLVGAIVVLWIVSSVPSGLAQLVAELFTGSHPARHHRADPWDVFGSAAGLGVTLGGGLVSQLVSALLMGGLMTIVLRLARGENYTFADLFASSRFFLPIFAVNVLVGVGCAIGFLFLIVPGVFLALAWSQSVLLVVDKDLGPIEALSKSFEITAGHRMNIFVFWLLAGLLGVPVLACTCFIGGLVYVPVLFVAQAFIYLRITGQPTAIPGAR